MRAARFKATWPLSVSRTWRDELAQIRAKSKFESSFLKSSRKLMQREPAKLESSQKQQLVELFQHSKALETMHNMRVELGAIWERSHHTRDQLLHQLEGGEGQRRTILRHRVDAHGNAVEQIVIVEGTEPHPRLHQSRLVEIAQHPFQQGEGGGEEPAGRCTELGHQLGHQLIT